MAPSGTYVSTSAAPEKFTLFPDLPAEIRLSIWHEALAIPQKVIFEVVQTPFSSNRAFMKRVTKVHPLLHVSQESRGEALRIYLKNRESRNEDIWDIWRYFRFGVDICELRNDSRVPWTFLVIALGKEAWGLERIMGRRVIAA